MELIYLNTVWTVLAAAMVLFMEGDLVYLKQVECNKKCRECNDEDLC